MNVAKLRHETALSQRQFAELFDIPVRTLQQWEQGKSSPPPYVVGMMEQLLSKKDEQQATSGRHRDNSGHNNASRHTIPRRKAWRVCIDRPFEECQRIYPTQQRKVRELIDDVARDSAVQSITVFGSSVTDRCHRGSDVDVYVEMADDHSPVFGQHDFSFDLWTNYTADHRLKSEISKTGVRVYGNADALR